MVNKRFWSETYQRFLSFRVHTDVIKKVKKDGLAAESGQLKPGQLR